MILDKQQCTCTVVSTHCVFLARIILQIFSKRQKKGLLPHAQRERERERERERHARTHALSTSLIKQAITLACSHTHEHRHTYTDTRARALSHSFSRTPSHALTQPDIAFLSIYFKLNNCQFNRP